MTKQKKIWISAGQWDLLARFGQEHAIPVHVITHENKKQMTLLRKKGLVFVERNHYLLNIEGWEVAQREHPDTCGPLELIDSRYPGRPLSSQTRYLLGRLAAAGFPTLHEDAHNLNMREADERFIVRVTNS
jgi:hypothetical protein